MEKLTIHDYVRDFQCDLRGPQREWVQYIKDNDRASYEIVRYGRLKGMENMLNDCIQYAKMHQRENFADTFTIKTDGVTRRKVEIKGRSGASKVAIIINNTLVIKATYDGTEFGDQTAQEFISHELYRTSDDERDRLAAKHLAPILQYFPCNKGPDGKYKQWPGVMLQVAVNGGTCSYDRACNKTGETVVTEKFLASRGMHDMHDENAGILNGVPVVLDYGLNEKFIKWANEKGIKWRQQLLGAWYIIPCAHTFIF